MCLCLASKKPSKQEYFVPAGMDLGVKLLRGKIIIHQNLSCEQISVLWTETLFYCLQKKNLFCRISATPAF